MRNGWEANGRKVGARPGEQAKGLERQERHCWARMGTELNEEARI